MNTTFTTQSEIERLLSADGVALRLDDIGSGTAAIDDIIADASEYIWQYCWTHYTEAQLQNNTWIRRRASYIAAHFLSQRRGNPGQFIDRFEDIKNELQLVYSRTLHVPEANTNVVNQPTVSNFIIDNRGYAPVQRVLPYESTGGYPDQRTTITNPWPEVV